MASCSPGRNFVVTNMVNFTCQAKLFEFCRKALFPLNGVENETVNNNSDAFLFVQPSVRFQHFGMIAACNLKQYSTES